MAMARRLITQTLGYPRKLWNELRKEALRRQDERGVLGEVGYRTEVRDIICLCAMLALAQVKEMSQEEYEKLVAKAKR
jgi:hypothetical protein